MGGTRVNLTTLGNVSFRINGTEITISSRKSQALLAYLATTPHGKEGRQRAAGLLWGDFEEAKARASLRQAIADLRQAFAVAPSILTADRLTVSVDLTCFEVDCFTILEALEKGEIPAILLSEKRLAERYLAGLEDLDPAFCAWLMVQRQSLHERFVRALEDQLAATREPPVLKRVGMAILNLEPSHEVGCRAVITACARVGDIGGALRTYKELWDLLDQEFDMEPSEETVELISLIKSGRFADLEGAPRALPGTATETSPPAVATANGVAREPAAVQGAAGPAGLTLIVTEFDVEAIAPERQSMVRAIRHDLIASLARFRYWSIIDGANATVLAQPWNGYRIDGTAFEDESGIRFVLTVRDSTGGRIIWSGQFAITPQAWLATQQRMIRHIAGALDISLSAERLALIAGSSDHSLALHDRWLRGSAFYFRWRPDDAGYAEAIFRSLIAEAPSFAPAYSSLVQLLNSRHLIFPGVRRTMERHQEALELAKMAVQLDPRDTRAHLSLAWSYAMTKQFERAPLSYRLACECNPNDPWTLVSAALGFAFCGDVERASATAEVALDLGLGVSRLHWGYQATLRFILGDYHGAIAAAENAGDLPSNLGGWKAAAHALVGDITTARSEGHRFAKLIRSGWFGAPDPDETVIAAWFLNCFPVADRTVWEALHHGVTLAGLAPPEAKMIPFRPERRATHIV